MKTGSSISKQLRVSLLGSVVEFMTRTGASEAAIRDAFESGMAKSSRLRAISSSVYQDGKYLQNGDISADLLRLWHRDGRYTDARDARPRPLFLSKGRNSVRSTILRLDSRANVAEVLGFLISAKLIRKIPGGKYLPTTEAGAIAHDEPFVAEHLARSVIRLFSTVRRNTNRSGPQPLIERYAYVTDLDRAHSEAFAEFTKSQGLAYLQTVDDWMEQRRTCRLPVSDRKKKPGVVAGVQIVAYLGDGKGGNLRAGAPVRRSVRNGTGGTNRSAARSKRSTPPPATHA
jgi:hypothetical protein